MDKKLEHDIRKLLDDGYSPWSISMILDIPQNWVYSEESDEEPVTQDSSDLY